MRILILLLWCQALSAAEFTADYLAQVARGDIAGHTIVHTSGYNASVADGVFELVSP